MSHKATNWLATIAPSEMTHGEFRVLFHLCDCHNPSGGCFPKQTYLREHTGLSNGGLNKALSGLEGKGLLRREKARDPNTKRQLPTRYILGFELPDTQPPTPLNGGGAVSTSGAFPSPLLEGSVSTGVESYIKEEPVKEPVKEPVNTPLTPQGGQVEIFEPCEVGSVSKQKIAGGLHPDCASLDDEFEMIWKAYPRKVAKGAAKKLWLRIRRKEDFETVAKPLGQFIRNSSGTDITMIPHLRTWLHQERWGDEQTHATNRQQTTDDQLDALMAQTTDGQMDALFADGFPARLTDERLDA